MINETDRQAIVPDPPRAVPRYFYLRRMRAMAFCGVLFALLGVGLGAGLSVAFYVLGDYVPPWVDLGLDRSHATTTATILDKKIIRHTHIHGRHPWRVRFRFTPANGGPVDAVGFTFDQSMASIAMGDTINVEYKPDNPLRVRPVGGTAAMMPVWGYAIILATLAPELIGGMVLLFMVRSRSRRVGVLLTHGPGVDAEVVAVRRISYIHFGSKSPYDVYYRFYDHRGLEVAGRDRSYHYDWAKALTPGDIVGVVYHPEAPHVNVLYLHGGDVAVNRPKPETIEKESQRWPA